jgi:NAD(P)-dependent dehydrogenase (short-subunit alcohol dehydrogenase family)
MASINKTVILVTGGNTGIGLEIVRKLASDSPNNQILLGCRDTHKGESAVASMGAPRNVNPIQLDITDDDSIEHAYLAIEQHFGKLDVLINNAGTAAVHEPEGTTIRQKFDLCMNVNVTSAAVLTEKMVPLLEKSKLPKVIFISSTLGSIGTVLQRGVMFKGPWYNSSKTAMNALAAYYSKLYPGWKVNAVCPGLRSTGLNDVVMSEESDPKHGAVRACELVAEGPNGVTGTYSRTGEEIPW